LTPKATTRFRQATAAVAIVWAVLALLAGVRARLESGILPGPPFSLSSAAGVHVIHGVAPEAAAAGISARDRLVAVDGERTSVWLREGGLRLSEGTPNAYRIRKPDGRELEVSLEPAPPGSFATPLERLVEYGVLAVGLVYLGIGLWVWRLRRDRRESWVLLLFCATTAALLFLVGPAYPPVGLMIFLTIPWIGATAFHLFTTYPMEPPWAVRWPELRVGVYVLAGVLALASAVSPQLGPAGAWLDPVVTFYASGLALLCVGLLTRERIRNRGHPSGARADVMLAGGFASYVPVIACLTWHTLWGTTFPWTVSLLGFFVFPVAVAWGVLRRALFDVRLAAKSSAAYGAVTLGITGLFALTITFADAVVSRFDVDATSPVFSVAFLFVAILLFNPLRVRVQGVVDRFFDRDRAAYRRAVREISEAMVSMLSAREIVDRILVAVSDTMGVERSMVLLMDEESGRLTAEAARGDWDDEALDFELSPDHPIARALWMRRKELAREDFDDEPDPELREQCRDVFDTLDVELLEPVLFGVDLLGVIAVGRKLSGEHLGPDERQLLGTLANQSAIAIENARAFDEIAQLNKTLEARVDERTRELRDTQAQLVQSEKMRSLGQLVAGVAHELNNPIGFVHANLQLLDEYVTRLLQRDLDPEKRRRTQEAISKLLARSREGTERVKRIVQDLRTFSRTDQAELQQVKLDDEIERTLALIEPRLKGIEVVRDYGELPPVRCFAGQLNQVFLNLLMNACDALDGRGTIRITTRAEQPGVMLRFEDDGPGMPPDVMSRIFEPFFTTKAVGKGTGLGLSLSHGIVARHGGHMEVDSRPGAGARFTIRLPLEPPPELEAAAKGMAA
jgi:two-component system NtrC family sensor kinase